MKRKKYDFLNSKYTVIALTALAVLLFVLSCVVPILFFRVFFILLTIAAIGGGSYTLFRIYQSGQNGSGNYFLYDFRRKCTIPRDKLTFPIVDDHLSAYLSPYVSNAADLFDGIPNKLSDKLKEEPAFRIPVAFKMLLDLSKLSEDDILSRFTQADEATVAAVCRALKAGGDKEMADLIFYLKRRSDREQERIVAFFSRNKRCFEGRIFHYIKAHINEYPIKQ